MDMEHIDGHALTFALTPNPLPRCLDIGLPLRTNPPPRPHPFPTRDMTDQQGSSRFQALLESALQQYEKKAGVRLANLGDSLGIQLQSCHSIDHIATLLQDKAQAFDDVQQHDRILKSIKATVSILTPISAIASAADGAGLVRQTSSRPLLHF